MGGGGSTKSCPLSLESIACDAQAGDWAEGMRMGCCSHQEGMRPTSGSPGCLPGFLGWPEIGVLSTLQSIPISEAQLSAEICRAATPATMPTSVHTSARSHFAQPSPLANCRAFHHPQKPPSPISSHSLYSLPTESPISNFHNALLFRAFHRSGSLPA